MRIRSGFEMGYPYSLSRWTDVAGSSEKWEWWRRQLQEGEMVAFDPTTGVPSRWSLAPQDTLGLIFWTRAPQQLIASAGALRLYRVKVHVTVTGWEEVERGAPGLEEGAKWLRRTVEEFGAQNVYWRFSPIPTVPDVVDRFKRILETAADVGLKGAYVSFLQNNDRVPETRSLTDQLNLLREMGAIGHKVGVQVRLCQEAGLNEEASFWKPAVCAPPEDFELPSRAKPTSEGCGCVHMVDPFTINEACVFGCTYCYTSSRESNPHKRNTTRLPVLRS